MSEKTDSKVDENLVTSSVKSDVSSEAPPSSPASITKNKKAVRLSIDETSKKPDAAPKQVEKQDKIGNANSVKKDEIRPHRNLQARLYNQQTYPPPFYLYQNYNRGSNYVNYRGRNGGQRYHPSLTRRTYHNQGRSFDNNRQNRRHLSALENDQGHESDHVRSMDGSKENLSTRKGVRKLSHHRTRSSHSETCEKVCPHTDDELEEPFSDSEGDEEKKKAKKKEKPAAISLPIPRNRIRTLSGMVPNIGYAPVWGGPTMCLNCFDFFDIPDQTSEYVDHLLKKHRIVVTDIELIVDLKRYIEFWRHRFGTEPIDKIFPEIIPGQDDPLFGKVEKFFLMSEKIPEDRQIRERLALRRLEEVLACQQRERNDLDFARQCLFCRYHVEGNRAKLIHHLYMIHHLNLGSPDNLVFVNEYLDVLQDKIQNGICIYCENHFNDPLELSEHMRQNGHREVNPENNYYDKFYVINYLELGKKWIEVLAEDFEDTMPTFQDSEEEEEEEAWHEWQEDNVEDQQASILCLFCDEVVQKLEALLDHLKEKHAFDLRKEIHDLQMNFYDRVKYINYIRTSCHKCVCFACGKDDLHSWPALRKHLNNEATPGHVAKIPHREMWDKDEYLIPPFDNDSLLCYLDEFDQEQEIRRSQLPADPAIVDQGPVILSQDTQGQPVIAEDAVDLSYTILSDKQLREQLQ